MAAPKKERGPHLFTLEEANQLLPQVREILKRLRKKQEEVRALEQKKAVEELSWLREDGTVSPKAEKGIAHLEESMESTGQAFEQALQELNALGAQLKDLDEGLIDFFTARNDTLVYLCWKDGEEKIRYWHDLESGAAGRQPLE